MGMLRTSTEEGKKDVCGKRKGEGAGGKCHREFLFFYLRIFFNL